MYTKKRKRFARAMCGLPYMALFFDVIIIIYRTVGA